MIKVKILMVDDHPSMIEGYKIILSYNNLGYEIETTSAYNCEDALTLISGETEYDLVFLDYALPPYEKLNINSGKDLGVLIRSKMPNAKIVILTSHSESIILYDIIHSIDPEGILVKSDFSADDLLLAFEKIMKGDKYLSATVTQNVKKLLSSEIYLDEYNRKIIALIAQGIKTKNMPNHMNLSISAIEKRKAQIKDYFGIEKGNDEEILKQAKKIGLL